MRKTASILCAFALVAATAGANENVTAKAAEDTYNVPSAPICVGAAINERDSLYLLDEEPADNALIRAEYRDGNLFVVDGEGVELFLLSQVIEAFEVADVVPVIRFDNAETVGALADFLVEKNVSLFLKNCGVRRKRFRERWRTKASRPGAKAHSKKSVRKLIPLGRESPCFPTTCPKIWLIIYTSAR